jgi:plasmid stabilization system protein ParE
LSLYEFLLRAVISNTPFIAAYAIDRADIIILAIYHGAQQWPEGF